MKKRVTKFIAQVDEYAKSQEQIVNEGETNKSLIIISGEETEPEKGSGSIHILGENRTIKMGLIELFKHPLTRDMAKEAFLEVILSNGAELGITPIVINVPRETKEGSGLMRPLRKSDLN